MTTTGHACFHHTLLFGLVCIVASETTRQRSIQCDWSAWDTAGNCPRYTHADDPHGASVARKVTLEDAAKQGSVCIDGSPGVYYMRPGSGDGRSKWVIYHQGDGWCSNADECHQRSLGNLGSSKPYPDYVTFSSGYLSDDAKINPMMYNWNVAFLMSCDGGSFTGNSTTQHLGKSLYFQGKGLLEAMAKDIWAAGLSLATDVVITGCSAGGLAAYLHVDKWAALFKGVHVKLVGLPDSGFFRDFDGVGKYTSHMKNVFELMSASSGVNQQCVDKYAKTKESWKCIISDHASPFITSPIFALQSAFDAAQSNIILCSTDSGAINGYGNDLKKTIETQFLATNPRNGAFLDSCFHHGGGWGTYYVGDTNQPAAFQSWYETGSAGLPNKGYFKQDKQYPCTACCSSPKLRVSPAKLQVLI